MAVEGDTSIAARARARVWTDGEWHGMVVVVIVIV